VGITIREGLKVYTMARYKVVSIKIEPSQHKAIAAYAREHGTNVSQLSRKLYAEALKNDGPTAA